MYIPDGMKPGYSGKSLVYGLLDARIDYMSGHSLFMPEASRNGHVINDYAPFRNAGSPAHTPPPLQARFTASMDRHQKYSSINKYVKMHGDGYVCTDDCIRELHRKCKAGLNWAAEDGVDVHFILDGIDLDAVVDKHLPPGAQFSITGSELRWLRRNWDRAGVRSSVRFWNKDTPVFAPWKTDPSLWSRYKPKSAALDASGSMPKGAAGAISGRAQRSAGRDVRADLLDMSSLAI